MQPTTALMALFYVLAGANHFRVPKFYLPMMPPWIPRHKLMIALSGVAELVLGLLLLFPATEDLARIGIVAMLIVFLPVHFYMLQMRKTIFAHIPALILFVRLPLQAVLIYWAW